MLIRAALAAALVAMLAGGAQARSGVSAPSIVLIGGIADHKPGVHDGQAGVRLLERWVRAAPALARFAVRSYPDGWPADPAAFDRAATIVWYFDGLELHPLRDPARRAQLARLTARGVGVVTLHQAGTVLPADGDLGMTDALGAVRPGMIDRTPVEVAATLTPTAHPVARGVREFVSHDEFYPTLSFAVTGVSPVLSGLLRLESAPAATPIRRTVAWAYRRPGGGRGFGYTGAHFLTAFDQPEVRQLMLNAIAWTAGVAVPAGGVRLDARRAAR